MQFFIYFFFSFFSFLFFFEKIKLTCYKKTPKIRLVLHHNTIVPSPFFTGQQNEVLQLHTIHVKTKANNIKTDPIVSQFIPAIYGPFDSRFCLRGEKQSQACARNLKFDKKVQKYMWFQNKYVSVPISGFEIRREFASLTPCQYSPKPFHDSLFTFPSKFCYFHHHMIIFIIIC